MVSPDIEIHDGLPEKLRRNLQTSKAAQKDTDFRELAASEYECQQWRKDRANGRMFVEMAEESGYSTTCVRRHVRGNCSHSDENAIPSED